MDRRSTTITWTGPSPMWRVVARRRRFDDPTGSTTTWQHHRNDHDESISEDDGGGDENNDLDARIAQEERWIRLHEAERSLLQRREEQQEAVTSDNNDNDNNPRNPEAAGLQQQQQQDPHQQRKVENREEDYENRILSIMMEFLANDDDSNKKDGASLDWINRTDNPHNQHKQQQESDDAPLWFAEDLQPLLRNFCFTRVEQQRHNDDERSHHTAEATIASSQQRHYAYTLHGYFLADQTVHAVMRLVVVETRQPQQQKQAQSAVEHENDREEEDPLRSKQEQQQRSQQSPPVLRIQDVHCSLVSKHVNCDDTNSSSSSRSNNNNNNNSDVTNSNNYCAWLEQQAAAVVRGSRPTHYLAQWMACIDEYLQFDGERRRQCLELESNATSNCCSCPKQVFVQHEHSRTLLRVAVYSRGVVAAGNGDLTNTDSGDGDGDSNSESSDKETEQQQQQPTPLPRKPHSILAILWTWRWKERRAGLRLASAEHDATAGAGGENDSDHKTATCTQQQQQRLLRQPDLDQLVRACGHDCWRAIRLLITHCSGCACWQKPPPAVRTHKKTRRGLEQDDDGDWHADADDEGDSHDDVDDDDSHFEVEHDDNSDSDDNQRLRLQQQLQRHSSTASPFRYSPVTGRRRSDYEVQRLQRIQRNERKLKSLGLLGSAATASHSTTTSASSRHWPSTAARADPSKTTTTKKKKRIHQSSKAPPQSLYASLWKEVAASGPQQPSSKAKPSSRKNKMRMHVGVKHSSDSSSASPSSNAEDKKKIRKVDYGKSGRLTEKDGGDDSSTAASLSSVEDETEIRKAGYAKSSGPTKKDAGDDSSSSSPSSPSSSAEDETEIRKAGYAKSTHTTEKAKSSSSSSTSSSSSASSSVAEKTNSKNNQPLTLRTTDTKKGASSAWSKPSTDRSVLPASSSQSRSRSQLSQESATNNIKSPAKSAKKVEDPLSFVLPKSPPLKYKDGSFAKPRGRPPLNHPQWDSQRGVWVAADETEQSMDDGGPADWPESSSASASLSASMSPALAAATGSTNSTPGKSTKEKNLSSFIPPKSPPKRRADGTFVRPLGRPFRNFVWCSQRGVWVPKGSSKSALANKNTSRNGEPEAEDGHKSSSSSNQAGDNIESSSESPSPKVTVLEKLADVYLSEEDSSSFISPKSPPSRKADGSYHKPCGRIPLGCAWNARRGVWVRVGKREGLSLSLETKPRKMPVGCVAQPRGRPPAGKVWDRIKGKWIVPSSSASLLKTIRAGEPILEHISVLELATKAPASNPKGIRKTASTREASDERSQTDSNVPTDSPLLQPNDGSIENGKASAATMPPVLGSGRKSAFHSFPSPSSSASVSGQLLIDGPEIPLTEQLCNRSAPTPETDNRTVTESNNLSATATYQENVHVQSDQGATSARTSISKLSMNYTLDGFGGCLLPKTPPKLLSNGTFQRPQRGLSPVNYAWDGSLGVWIPSATDLPFDEKFGDPSSTPVSDEANGEAVNESRKRKGAPNHDSASSIARRAKCSSENESTVEESKGKSRSAGESR